MADPTLSALKNSLLILGIEPPPEYLWIIEHKMLGFDSFTQFEPWLFCSPSEITSLADEWPTLKLTKTLISFARMQGSDDLACFEFEQKKLKQIVEFHYDLGPPVYLETTRVHPDLWAWLRSAINDVKLSFDLSQKRPNTSNK